MSWPRPRHWCHATQAHSPPAALGHSIARYLSELVRADRDPSLVPEARIERLKEKIATVREQMKKLEAIGRQPAVAPDQQVSPLVPEPLTNNAATTGRFDKRDFHYDPKRDARLCFVVASATAGWCQRFHTASVATSRMRLARDEALISDEQTSICAAHGAHSIACDPNMKVGIALATPGNLPLNALRHQPEEDTTGWYILGGDFSESPDFFLPLHAAHLADVVGRFPR